MGHKQADNHVDVGHRSMEAPRRFRPKHGRLLTLEAIKGPWRPSGAVAGAGVFAVIWATERGSWWAPLHDFESSAMRNLVDQCRAVDQEANWLRAGWRT